MKNKIALILILTLIVALCAVFAACVDPHEHDLQHFEAKDPTCEKEGNIEYWYCAGCGKYFADEAAGKEIAKEKTVLSATGEHDWSEWVAGEGENCETGGTLRRSCSICGKTEEQTFSAGSHKLEYMERVPSTCVEAGSMAHWHCERCGKNYADQNAEELIENVSLPFGAHNIVNGKCTVCGLDKTFIEGTPGLQYTLNEEGTAYIASGIGTATETDIVIASEYNGLPVTSIADKAFAEGYKRTSVFIPSSVKSIGKYAFRYCYFLKSVTMEEGVTSIGDHAFEQCVSLASIDIPDSVTSIGDHAFEQCALASIDIPDSVTSIGNHAFKYCSQLESIRIGSGVTSIGDYAFSGCSSLESIVAEEGNAVYHSEGNCLIETDSKTLIVGCKNSVIPSDGSVTRIGDHAFALRSSLTSIVIPEGVTSIGEEAFWYCSSLTSIVIPEGVTSIGDSAFWYCSSLTSIIIPEGVTSIGPSAFGGCSSLTSITIPDSVTSIGDCAFGWCNALTSINFQGSMAQWKSIDKEGLWNYTTGSFTITCTDGTLDKNGNQI